MTFGMPNFRLEKDVVNAEIDVVRELGVEIKCGIEVGKDVTIQQLRDEGYKGFYVGPEGARTAPARSIRTPGSNGTCAAPGSTM